MRVLSRFCDCKWIGLLNYYLCMSWVWVVRMFYTPDGQWWSFTTSSMFRQSMHSFFGLTSILHGTKTSCSVDASSWRNRKGPGSRASTDQTHATKSLAQSTRYHWGVDPWNAYRERWQYWVCCWYFAEWWQCRQKTWWRRWLSSTSGLSKTWPLHTVRPQAGQKSPHHVPSMSFVCVCWSQQSRVQ